MNPVAEFARAVSGGARVALGLDGQTVEQAVEAAWTPTGPDRAELHRLITARRGLRAA